MLVSSQTMRAAAVQVRLPLGEVEANRARFAEILESLPDADLVVAPELFISGYDLEMVRERGEEVSEPLDGPTSQLVSGHARRTGTTVVVGIVEHDGDGTLFDTALVATPDGGVRGYRKSHLFPAETPYFGAGEELMTIPTPAGVIGPQICFEHAFPAISTALARRGAQVLVIPSAVGAGYDHLLTLRSRARAQDNQVFVVAANLNTDGFCGFSVIADPKGRVLAAADDQDAILRADLDLSLIETERRQEPSLRLSRDELYGDPEAAAVPGGLL